MKNPLKWSKFREMVIGQSEHEKRVFKIIFDLLENKYFVKYTPQYTEDRDYGMLIYEHDLHSFEIHTKTLEEAMNAAQEHAEKVYQEAIKLELLSNLLEWKKYDDFFIGVSKLENRVFEIKFSMLKNKFVVKYIGYIDDYDREDCGMLGKKDFLHDFYTEENSIRDAMYVSQQHAEKVYIEYMRRQQEKT